MWWFIIIVILVAVFSVPSFWVANKLLKKTGWWKNQFLATAQFDLHGREVKYDVVNLGSNPSRFAFFYENVLGQSFATGSQSQAMDLAILKSYRHQIKDGGTVLVAIMPFTSIATYLKERPEYWDTAYYAKFAKILNAEERAKLPNSSALVTYLKYPLLSNVRLLKQLVFGWHRDNRYDITEQPLMHVELQDNAQKWIDGWLKEFRLKNLEEVFDSRWHGYYQEAIDLCKEVVKYCKEEDLKPVFICVPMSHYLSDLFPADVRKFLVTDFVNACNEHDIPFLDYTLDPDFQDASLYFDSFFLNKKGRKLFTRRVLKDLKIC